MRRASNRSIQSLRTRGILYRNYHSYPDPSEKAIVTTSRSSATRQLDKTKLDFKLNERFNIEKPFLSIDSKSSGTLQEALCYSTILSNGLRVASEDRHTLMTSIAFVVKTGSSYETDKNTGVTQLLELNAFKSTINRSHFQLSSDIENLGGAVQCISTRENIFYCIDILRDNVEAGLDILAGNTYCTNNVLMVD